MIIRVFDDPAAAGQAAATIIAAQIMKKPNSVLGFATGSTPVPAYKSLVSMRSLDFTEVRTYNLDEYVSLGSGHEQSYHYFMHQNLFNHVNIKRENVHLPNGLAPDLAAECTAYENAIAGAGGIDLQLLGIGHNGHIGFNEPGDTFIMDTHVVELTESTINANMINFKNDPNAVPRKALTMGIGTIMKARSILMVITGKSKAEAVARMLTPGVDPRMPATILQCHHDVTVILDKEAASIACC